MACAFTHDIFEMIAMIAELRTARCWSGDQAAARKLETPTARHWHGHRSLRSSKLGGRGSFTMLPRHYEPTGSLPSAVVCHMSRPPSPRIPSQHCTLSGSDRVAMSCSLPPARFASFPPPFGVPMLPVLARCLVRNRAWSGFVSCCCPVVEVRSYGSARASGAPLLCRVPTDLLYLLSSWGIRD